MLINGYYTLKNFLTEKECSDILRKYSSEIKLSPGKVGRKNISKDRKSSVGFIKNIDNINQRLKSLLKDVIKIKGHDVDGLGPYQFTKYQMGDYYNWHTDSSETEEIYKDRYCSVVIQLNDNYDDGVLEIEDKNGKIIQLNKGIGVIHVFYSDMLHRVTTVTNGVRFSLVNWVSLNKSDNFKNSLI